MINKNKMKCSRYNEVGILENIDSLAFVATRDCHCFKY